MVLGQYRLSSHSSSQPAHSQLSPGEMPRGRTALSNRETGDAVLQPQILHLPSLGRTAAQAGRLWTSQDRAPGTEISARGLSPPLIRLEPVLMALIKFSSFAGSHLLGKCVVRRLNFIWAALCFWG